MNYLVVGAGNASRPVARLLNYLGHQVVITDLKDISEFKIEFQRSLIEMEKEGVTLDLANKDPSVDGFDAVYMPPTLPESAPIAQKVKNSELIIVDLTSSWSNPKHSKIFFSTSLFKITGCPIILLPINEFSFFFITCLTIFKKLLNVPDFFTALATIGAYLS